MSQGRETNTERPHVFEIRTDEAWDCLMRVLDTPTEAPPLPALVALFQSGRRAG
jgi:hypothetical protein